MTLWKGPVVTLGLAAAVTVFPAYPAGPATLLRSINANNLTVPLTQPILGGAATGTGFPVIATDDANLPVPGATVTFTAGQDCGDFGGQHSVNVTADANGIATSPVFTASSTVTGDCAVLASVGGGTPMMFSTPIITTGQLMVLGRSQSYNVTKNTDFPFSFSLIAQLATGGYYIIPYTQATLEITDAYNGGGATFPGGSIVTTNERGSASVMVHANDSSGGYNIKLHAFGVTATTAVTQYDGSAGLQLKFAKALTNVQGGQSFDVEVDATLQGGSPAAGRQLRLDFECYEFVVCVSTEASFTSTATTDANGRAHFTAVAGDRTGAYGMRATLVGAPSLQAEADVMQTSPVSQPVNYQDMWWAGAIENGWGMSVVQHGTNLFTVLFVYDAQGNPVWFVLPAGSWDSTGKAWTGSLYRPHSSWWFRYDTTKFAPGAPVGTATITFSDPNTARLDYTIDGQSGSKSIGRQLFGTRAGAAGSFGDMWWGGDSQNGWGIAILEQPPKIFPIWYTYNESGNPVWYVVPDGTWSNETFTGHLFSTTGSPWVGRTYDATALRVTTYGPFRLDIQGHDSMYLNLGSTLNFTAEGLYREPF